MPDFDIAAVADSFINSDFANDLPQLMELVAPLIDYDATVALARSLELCPVHFCDEQICADDDREDCRATRALLADEDDQT